MKTILFKQPVGLGDILFCQKIAKTLSSQGNKVIWPVDSIYSNTKPYLNGFGVEYIDIADNFSFKDLYQQCPKARIITDNDCTIIATDGCTTDKGFMISKYQLVGLDWSDWEKYVTFNRNNEKENKLFHEVLGLNDSEPYALINNYIGTPPNHVTKLDLEPKDTNLRKVFLEMLPGFTLFDWCKVVEKAAEIYIEGSALSYICEKLDLSASKLVLYTRNRFLCQPPGFFKKPWIYNYSKSIF